MVSEALINTQEGILNYLAGGVSVPGLRVVRNSVGGLSMAVEVQGIIRGGTQDGNEKKFAVTPRGEQIITLGLPPYAEMSRQGKHWSAMATSAVAGLVVRPSTTAAVTLWNGESTGGKSYVIDRIFTHNLVSTAAQTFFGMWACIHPAGMTEPTADIAASATNFVGSSGNRYSGSAVLDVGATVVDNGWFPWGQGQEVEAAGVLPGSHQSIDVLGRLIVPPQGAISLQVVAGVTGDTFTSGLSWWEVQLDLE